MNFKQFNRFIFLIALLSNNQIWIRDDDFMMWQNTNYLCAKTKLWFNFFQKISTLFDIIWLDMILFEKINHLLIKNVKLFFKITWWPQSWQLWHHDKSGKTSGKTGILLRIMCFNIRTINYMILYYDKPKLCVITYTVFFRK